MYFLNPIWLFALAAISIPVAIHLWNFKPGKVLKVGSILLFEEASRKSRRSLSLTDLLLLLLRCLLLMLLAMLLAKPLFDKQINASRSKGWILIPREIFGETYQKYKKSIDSLDRAGFEFHFYNDGLPKADLAKLLTLASQARQPDSTAKQPSNYWTLLKQVDAQVPASLPVYLFTINQLSHFKGTKPQVALNLQWQTYTTADSASNWIEKAYFTDRNEIRIVQGNSKPSGTFYSYYNVQSDGANSPVQITVNNGRPFAGLKNSKTQDIAVDTSTTHIAVFTDNYTVDANYLKAALQTGANFTQHRSLITQYHDADKIPRQQDWLFWLSDKPVPANISANAKNVFSYQAGKIISANSWIATEGIYALPNGGEHISLFKRINAADTNNRMIWRDGFGYPLLTMYQTGDTKIYRFYNRFNPSWSDLVWDGRLPKLIMQLLLRVSTPISHDDKRIIDRQQIQPVLLKGKEIIPAKFKLTIDLSRYFWLMLIVLLVVERWLSGRNKLTIQNG